ncbi:MAG: hypothetical protein LBH43_08855 [Treponema sp.]|jgi:hypothetical protein|nr:hypothetical protein [Treponema sp.]
MTHDEYYKRLGIAPAGEKPCAEKPNVGGGELPRRGRPPKQEAPNGSLPDVAEENQE